MPDGNVKVFMKGADNFIYDRLTQEHRDSEAAKTTMQDIGCFGDNGLRTLLYSQKEVTAAEYDAWHSKWAAAQLDPNEERRTETCCALAVDMEEGHSPVGASAIEDKLQENVGDTLSHLAEAGIQTWVLTGDKTNTAIMIGYACCLLTQPMDLVLISTDKKGEGAGDRICKRIDAARKYYEHGEKECPVLKAGPVSSAIWYRKALPAGEDGSNLWEKDVCAEALEKIPADQAALYEQVKPTDKMDAGELAMVIEGTALMQIGIGEVPLTMGDLQQASFECLAPVKDPDEMESSGPNLKKGETKWQHYAKRFTGFANKCKAVVACRVSPSQKAEVCKCVKMYLQKTTLCIGDGANDVAMILEAHVGVGIAGLEGSQAVNNADFALCKFRDLERILLVHGRWSYKRLGYVCLYILYKNITFCLLFAFFAFYSGYSGIMPYDDNVMACYNVFFSSLPCLIYGFFEQDVSDRTSRAFPIAYRPGQVDGVVSFGKFLVWVLEAVWHAVVVFFFAFIIQNGALMGNGQINTMWEAGNTAFTANLFIISLRIAMDTMHFTWPHITAYLIGIALWFMFILWYTAEGALSGGSNTYYNVRNSIYMLLPQSIYWLLILGSCGVALLPTFIAYAWTVMLTPNIPPLEETGTADGGQVCKTHTELPWWMPDPLSDLSVMYHLRHYQMDPAKYVIGADKRMRMGLTPEST